jgi:hypothetical protein
MKLAQLNPSFLKLTDKRGSYLRQDKLEGADGIVFLCPKCLEANGGDAHGVHSVICLAPHVALATRPGPGRWTMTGKGYDDLTLSASAASIKLEGGCNAHFFIRGGEIQGA